MERGVPETCLALGLLDDVHDPREGGDSARQTEGWDRHERHVENLLRRHAMS